VPVPVVFSASACPANKVTDTTKAE